MQNERNVSKKAIFFVERYERKQGREVINVQHNQAFKGFDLISISKNKKDIRTIEVKGTIKEKGIPDCFETEFTRNKKLIATHMYVVSYINLEKPILYIIPASVFKPEHLKETLHYRISSNFKTKILPKFKVK